MFAVSQIGEFDEAQDDIDAYMERMEHCMEANRIEGPPPEQENAKDQRVSVLLMVIGARPYGVLRNLLTPSQPSDKTYAELKNILKTHYKPQSLVIAERFCFYRRG